MTTNISSRNIVWTPRLGAWPQDDTFHFRVWAPQAKDVQVVFSGEDSGDLHVPLSKNLDGYFSGWTKDRAAGNRYGFLVDGKGPFPDPASRYQPEGVHGLSALVDSRMFHWDDFAWKGIEAKHLVFYELHIGTFTPEGTFNAALSKLPYLRDLGITAIEIMPVADFPGNRNWGYDGVDLYAPARCYGTPDDLRRLANEAHRLGLAIFLDVVYNHWGPDGNYTSRISPFYLTDRHQSPWGAGVNLDGPESRPVRDFFIENALYWLHDFHFDGLRLDATHALMDEGPTHFLFELAEQVHESIRSRLVHVIAEDDRNLTRMIQSQDQGGWGLDGVWSDDFHHEIRRLLAGDQEGYYRDYEGSVRNLVTAIEKGWLFTGQYSRHFKKPRGQDPLETSYERFVIFIQNHDQVGNRAFGERLNHQISEADYRAASALLLFCPETPLLFMGQEWAASSPFLYFTDHSDELGKRVTQGRRREFQHFSSFRASVQRAQIPDPQQVSTFLESRLPWKELVQEPHRGMLKLYKTLLWSRKSEPALLNPDRGAFRAQVIDDSTLLLERSGLPAGKQVAPPALAMAVRFKTHGKVQLPLSSTDWSLAFHTEEPSYARDGKAPRVEASSSTLHINFEGPCAVLFRRSQYKGIPHV